MSRELSSRRAVVLSLVAMLLPLPPAMAMNDPATGRWITRDPIKYNNEILDRPLNLAEPQVSQGGLSGAGDLYVFLSANPNKHQDWSGLIITTCNTANNGLTACTTTNAQCCHKTCICTQLSCEFSPQICFSASQGYTCQGSANKQKCTKCSG